MKRLLLVAALMVLAAAALACKDGDGDGVTPLPDSTPSPSVTEPAGETPDVDETPVETPTAEAEVCQPNPDPATAEFQLLDEPSPGERVTSPVTISGRIAAFEANFHVTIFDASEAQIVDVSGMAEGGAPALAPFSIDVPFMVDAPTPACIWVYEASAMDGSPTHVGQIPVTLLP